MLEPEPLVAIDDAAEPQTVPEKRRAQIVDAAVRLFSERGYFQTTIGDVANAVPISKGLVYRYFKDKTDLLFFCLRYVLDKYKQEEVPALISEIGALGALMRVLNLHCILAKEHTLEIVLAYKSTRDLSAEQQRQIKIFESKTARMIRQCLEACIHGGLFKKLNTDIMAYQYIMFGHTWALKNWAFRDTYTADEYMAEGEEILIIPFLTEAGLAEYKRIKEIQGGVSKDSARSSLVATNGS